MNPVDIIIPVYSGYSETVRCLQSVLKASCRTNAEIIVIYDAGPEPLLLDYLRGLEARSLVTLLVNSQNIGFVETANRGMALHDDRDVVLLNSDTEVANDWLDRLAACAKQDEKIATVTPFSNNAEICSFPKICRNNTLPVGWSVAQVDQIFADSVTAAAVDIPTAVGFCMYIARAAIEQVGYFNAKLFGRGYGEENDFCRRVAAMQWRNVLCNNVFVAHSGGVSFGAEKIERVENAMRILDRLYPEYHRLVHEFIAEDSPKIFRTQALLAMLDRKRARILAVSHNMDGGTAKHVHELASHISGHAYIFLARFKTPDRLVLSVETELDTIELCFEWPLQREKFLTALTWLGIGRIHIHHIKNAEHFVVYLLENSALPIDITLHDYYYINGNPALVDKTGAYCADRKGRDEICAEYNPVPLGYTAQEWRIFCEKILKRADRIFSPSEFTAKLYGEYFPKLLITVLPHPDWESQAPYPAVRRLPCPPGETLVIAVLGALSLEKGADILERVAFLAEKKNYPLQFHLLGYAYRELNAAVITHGSYADELLDEKLAAINPHIVWFPCRWPETYSYTLSACLRSGYPVLAPAIGAFIERLAGRPLSWLEPYLTSPAHWLAKLVSLRDEVFSGAVAKEAIWNQQRVYPTSYRMHYLVDAVPMVPTITPQEWFDLLSDLPLVDEQNGAYSIREKILRLFLRMHRSPLLRRFVRLIPFSWQRKLKRALSSRALHQIADDLL